jgi:hypothetical protein
MSKFEFFICGLLGERLLKTLGLAPTEVFISVKNILTLNVIAVQVLAIVAASNE